MHATKAHTNNASATVQFNRHMHKNKTKQNKTKQNKKHFLSHDIIFIIYVDDVFHDANIF